MSSQKMIESLTKEQRKVFDEICLGIQPLRSMAIASFLESKGLIIWKNLDIMSGFYEVANRETYMAWNDAITEELKASLGVACDGRQSV
jgi:hypothetical protein